MNTPPQLREILDLLGEDLEENEQGIISDYILVTRAERLDGAERVVAYSSDGLSTVAACGMLHIAQGYFADEHFDDDLDDDE